MRLALCKYAGDDDHLEEVEELWMDGYQVGERQLEGLPIKITIEDGALTCTADWPKGLDADYWAKRAAEVARHHDVFSTDASLTNDDGAPVQEWPA